MNEHKIEIFNLQEIASWWLPHQLETVCNIIAALPPLQRSFVWKTDQVENLWDSITQEFPIGSLLLSKINDPDKQKTVLGKQADGYHTPTHFLLDGQQRVTSIAMGFRNIWDKNNSESIANVTATLWVDLDTLENNDRTYAFRVVTKSHPWGYQKTQNNRRLNKFKTEEAFRTFKYISKKESIVPHQLELSQVFPWESHNPIPVPLLIESIIESKYNNEADSQLTAEILWGKFSKTNIWVYGRDDKNISERFSIFERLANKNSSNEEEEKFNHLVKNIYSALRNLRIPAPEVPEKFSRIDENQNTISPIFKLFKRINTGGTDLTQEEINYSYLKTIWPEAPEIIENKILSKRYICTPSRLISLLSRLYLMVNNQKIQSLQALLSISQFQKIISEDSEGFQSFCEKRGEEIVERIWMLLVGPENTSNSQNSIFLNNYLAAQIARQSEDLMLVFMYWVYLNSRDIKTLNTEESRRILGFVTAICWFSDSTKKPKIARLLCKELILFNTKHTDMSEFFNHETFNKLLLVNDSQILLSAFIKPSMLKRSLLKHIDNQEHLKKHYWENFSTDNCPDDIINFFKKTHNLEDDNGVSAKTSWNIFFNHIRAHRELLIYAQNKFFKDFFDWFDPTLPDQINNQNRPWDDDHVLPKSWTNHDTKSKNETPIHVRDWVHSNGNFRIWPMELNRSKSNKTILESKCPEYNLKNSDEVQAASFISKSELELLDVFCDYQPINNIESHHWDRFVKFAIRRTVNIYRNWYENFKIDELMK